jgi:hypothetical protein
MQKKALFVIGCKYTPHRCNLEKKIELMIGVKRRNYTYIFSVCYVGDEKHGILAHLQRFIYSLTKQMDIFL